MEGIVLNVGGGVAPVFIFAVVAVIVLAAVKTAVLRGSPRRIGNSGERIVRKYLSQLPQNDYHLCENLLLPSAENDTEIDHVVFSRFGIFVIETKHYSGWIFAGQHDRKWTQSVRRGRRGSARFTFQNPFRQNFAHIAALRELTRLPESVFHNLVVFSGDAEFKTPIENVLAPSDLVPRITAHQSPVLSEEQVNDAVAAVLGEMRQFVPGAKKHHIKNLRKKYS